MTHLWQNRSGRLSFQVLQEYYVTVTRKLRPGLEASIARQDVRNLLAWKPVEIGSEVLQQGWDIQDEYGFSFWDALIVSAAKISGCETVLTEDLKDDQRVKGVQIRSPFKSSPP